MTTTDMLDEDPNAANHNQLQLKRVEMAIRRQCDCDLLLFLDEIALESDPSKVTSGMRELKQRLDEKMKG